MLIIHRASPHFSDRPAAISLIVLHCDAGKTDEGTLSWLANPKSKVSYHYLVGRDGTIYQIVDEAQKAWHAGVSEFQGVKLCNNYSIGCAFANRNDGEPYTPAALASMAELCRDIMARHPAITKDRITTHYIVSPGRKSDPVPPFSLTAFLEMI